MIKLYRKFKDFLKKELRVHSPTNPEPWSNNRAEICVCCGAIIPEGRQVCPSCEKKVER